LGVREGEGQRALVWVGLQPAAAAQRSKLLPEKCSTSIELCILRKSPRIKINTL